MMKFKSFRWANQAPVMLKHFSKHGILCVEACGEVDKTSGPFSWTDTHSTYIAKTGERYFFNGRTCGRVLAGAA
jgi:hypothetical protein